ncbi:hypothetical protein L484_017920 [Morus notabilis]|uniref:Uncharacterized protein n=1 Tax=Morus notabilis TaxID=981085 RepID=W9RHB4_9ROSA|nr:hypothetical protein L484_017920 [Morus notabilis]
MEGGGCPMSGYIYKVHWYSGNHAFSMFRILCCGRSKGGKRGRSCALLQMWRSKWFHRSEARGGPGASLTSRSSSPRCYASCDGTRLNSERRRRPHVDLIRQQMRDSPMMFLALCWFVSIGFYGRGDQLFTFCSLCGVEGFLISSCDCGIVGWSSSDQDYRLWGPCEPDKNANDEEALLEDVGSSNSSLSKETKEDFQTFSSPKERLRPDGRRTSGRTKHHRLIDGAALCCSKVAANRATGGH